MHGSMRVLRTTLAVVCWGGACTKSPPSEPPPPRAPEPRAEAVEAHDAAVPEIKLGQIMPYTGPASTYGNIGRLQAAYFEMINRRGGIGGRHVNLLSLDDAYSPARAMEQVRLLVEQERVLAIFNPVGTPSNLAIERYLNERKVPQLFVSTGASRWTEPADHPWTLGFNPSYRLEGKTYARHILETRPRAKIGVLLQDDDFGKDLLAGLREGLGARAPQIVAQATYVPRDAAIDAQIGALHEAGADTVVLIVTPKFAIQAIGAMAARDFRPTRYLANVSASVGTVLTQAGLEASEGLLTARYLKDPTDKRWADDPGMKEWFAFMNEHYPAGDTRDGLNAYAYVAAQTLVHVLERCGDDLSPKNLLVQATSLRDFAPGMLLPGVTINTSPSDYELFDRLELARFDGSTWVALDAPPHTAAVR